MLEDVGIMFYTYNPTLPNAETISLTPSTVTKRRTCILSSEPPDSSKTSFPSEELANILEVLIQPYSSFSSSVSAICIDTIHSGIR